MKTETSPPISTTPTNSTITATTPATTTNGTTTTTIEPTSTPRAPVCISGWTFFEHTGLCYSYVSNKTIQADALQSCENSLGEFDQTVHLVSIPDEITNNFLTTITIKESWTGGYQPSGKSWHWSDESPWTGYSNWNVGQPDNRDWSAHEWGGWEDYLGINFEGVGKWNDYPPLYTMGTLCQYDPTLQFTSATTTEIEGITLRLGPRSQNCTKLQVPRES